MASIQSIAKAQAYGLGLQTVTGVEPQYDYQAKFTRVYYDASHLPAARKSIAKMIAAPTGDDDIKIDWLPLIAPTAAKAVVPAAIGLLLIGYLVGKKL